MQFSVQEFALVIANNGPEISFGGGQRTLMAIKILEAQGYKVEMLLLINIKKMKTE